MLRPGGESESAELVLAELHPGVEIDQVRAATGWDLRVAEDPGRTPPATGEELGALRELVNR